MLQYIHAQWTVTVMTREPALKGHVSAILDIQDRNAKVRKIGFQHSFYSF